MAGCPVSGIPDKPVKHSGRADDRTTRPGAPGGVLVLIFVAADFDYAVPIAAQAALATTTANWALRVGRLSGVLF
jgi:hypothetical protein